MASAAAPLAAATPTTVPADLRLTFENRGIGHLGSFSLPISAAVVADVTAKVLALNPGNPSAPVGTRDRELAEQWSTNSADGLARLAENVASGGHIFRGDSNIYTPGPGTNVYAWATTAPITAGTVISARYSSPGWTFAGTRGAPGTTFTQTAEGLVVQRSLPFSISISGSSIFGDVVIRAAAADPRSLTFGQIASRGPITETLTGVVLSPDSSPAGNSASVGISTGQYSYNEGGTPMYELLQTLSLIVQNHNYASEMWPEADSTVVDIDSLNATVLLTGAEFVARP